MGFNENGMPKRYLHHRIILSLVHHGHLFEETSLLRGMPYESTIGVFAVGPGARTHQRERLRARALFRD